MKLVLKFSVISYNFILLHLSNFITNPATIHVKELFHYYCTIQRLLLSVANFRQIKILKETSPIFLAECVAVILCFCMF